MRNAEEEYFHDDPVDDSDFYNSFSYHDSVISIPPKVDSSGGYIAQIYFPTAELAGRIASISPRIFHDAIFTVFDERISTSLLKYSPLLHATERRRRRSRGAPNRGTG